jgi:hypothetical protein
VHLDRGYDSRTTRQLLAERGMTGQVAERARRPGPGQPTVAGGADSRVGQLVQEAVVEHRTPRPDHRRVPRFAYAIITLRRLIRCAWTLYRWDTRPPRRP